LIVGIFRGFRVIVGHGTRIIKTRSRVAVEPENELFIEWFIDQPGEARAGNSILFGSRAPTRRNIEAANHGAGLESRRGAVANLAIRIVTSGLPI
jgi:hypothetical protein